MHLPGSGLIQVLLRELYRKVVPAETRFWLYKARNRAAVEGLRVKVNPSPKGDFSLRRFDELNAIFVHVPKSAGTSVALSMFGELPYHYTASQYRVIFGRRTFNSYFKFAFVRNPWDRLYSAYRYLKAGGWNDNDKAWFRDNVSHLPSFDHFVNDWLSQDHLHAHMHFRPQYEFICDRRGRVLVDYLGYFETLSDDFNIVAEKIGSEARLAHRNASPRDDYRRAYTPETRQIVAQLYARDIELFGYGFSGIEDRKKAGDRVLVDA